MEARPGIIDRDHKVDLDERIIDRDHKPGPGSFDIKTIDKLSRKVIIVLVSVNCTQGG